MSAQILDGRACAKQIKAELTEAVATLAESGVVPGLGTVLVGEDPGSTLNNFSLNLNNIFITK